jgi:mRNA-degrading endonuclease toxin of MazEF toxin-antitoxin module
MPSSPAQPPEILQGEIYWVDVKYIDAKGHEQKKPRPFVIVSRNQINRQQPTVVGVPLTSKMHQAKGVRLKVYLQHQVPNPLCTRQLMDCVALTDHIRVLDKSRLEQPKMGDFSDTAKGGLEMALSTLFDIR